MDSARKEKEDNTITIFTNPSSIQSLATRLADLSTFARMWGVSRTWKPVMGHHMGLDFKDPVELTSFCLLRARVTVSSTSSVNDLWSSIDTAYMAFIFAEMFFGGHGSRIDTLTAEDAVCQLRKELKESKDHIIMRVRGTVEADMYTSTLAAMGKQIPSAKTDMKTATCLAIMAMAKRGKVTDTWIKRWTAQLIAEGVLSSQRRPTVGQLATIWQLYERVISLDTLDYLFKKAPAEMESPSLGLIAAQGVTMTAYSLILEMKEKHKKFPWEQLADLFPAENAAIKNVCEALKDNYLLAYTIHAKNMGVTKYPNIFMAARMLKEGVDMDREFTHYRGLNNSSHASQLQGCVAKYKQYKNILESRGKLLSDS